MARIVIVGGTRFIGHAAATAAIACGHDVIVLHRGQHRCEVAGAREVTVDRGDPSALAREVAMAHPDVVVDTRAMTKADAQTIALAAKIANVPVVVLSSQDVYAAWGAILGHPAPTPEPTITEDSPLTVPFPYRGRGHPGGDDYDKKEVEQVLRDSVGAGLAGACVLRLPMVYGPRDYQRRFGDVVDRLDVGEDLPCQGGARWRGPHADVRDVAHAIVLAAEQARAGFTLYNVCEAVTPTMHERVEAIAAAMGVTPRWRETDQPLDGAWMLFGRLPDVVVDSTRIRGALGFTEVTTAEQRVGDLIAWCRQTRLRIVENRA